MRNKNSRGWVVSVSVILFSTLGVVGLLLAVDFELFLCEYCGADSHTAKFCAKKAVDRGAVGRWVIPDVGIDVACYSSIEQSMCDAKDSACYFPWGGMTLIADHWYQGFNAIKRCEVGTVAYLNTGDSVQKYICTEIIRGYNTGAELTDKDGNSIADKNPAGITCYTCSVWSQENVTIVFFAPGG